MQISRQRLYFTGVLALGVHAVVLLGFNSSSQQPAPVSPPLAIALQRAGDAQTQDGSQTTAEAAQTEQTPRSQSFSTSPITPTPNQSAEAVVSPETKPTPVPPEPISRPKPRLDRQSLTQQILRFDQQAERKLGDSRTRNLENVGAPSTDEAAYLAMWRRKCERLGGNNYPPGRLQGELTMRVVIHHTGQLLEVALLRSSGHPILDEAALETVRQAAPYQPFNVAMRKRYDRLSFTRTWQFSRRGASIN
ncbi:MAG: TonB family protein [Pseudomonadales bacterium]|jgi:protein TonB|nr:TonB family protein [Pseudomonadales bacterium]